MKGVIKLYREKTTPCFPLWQGGVTCVVDYNFYHIFGVQPMIRRENMILKYG